MVISLLVVSAVLLLTAAVLAWRRLAGAEHRVRKAILVVALVLAAGTVGLAVLRAVVDPGAGPTAVEALGALVISLLLVSAAAIRGPSSSDTPAVLDAPTAAGPPYRALIENALDVIVVLDAGGTILYANPAIHSALGYDPDRLPGASIFPSIHPSDRDRVEQFFLDRQRVPGAAPTVEFRFRHKDGSWRFLEAAASNLLEDGSVGAIVVAARDVTTRKLTEVELEGTVHRLALVVGSAPVVLFALDTDGRFTLSEGRGLETLGLRPGEVVGRSVWELYEGQPAVLDAVRRALDGVEVREVLLVGDLVFDTSFTPVFSDDARVAEVVGVATDVTARERTREALQHSEAGYRALVEHATYGMYRSTAGGSFVSVNPALVRMLGYDSEEELLGADLARDVYGEPTARSTLVERYRDAERIDSLEIEWRRKDGTPILVRLGGRPIRGPDRSVAFYEMIVEDVTERRALEEQLRQAQKMEAVGQLTGGIAHDFNNLLTVILANADILEAGLPAERRDLVSDLDDLRRAARRGSDMVRKLLGYSRRGMLAVRPLDLCTFLAELIPTLRRLLPEHIEVRFEPATQRAGVVADEGALEQILFNLATNARDAMPQGGSLTLIVDRVADGAHAALEEWGASGDYVRVRARDTGSGMNESTKARIFDPFFTTKRVGQGTGLGMAMVYGLIKQQGGFIEVQSAVGEGTTVNLYLPPDPSAESGGAAVSGRDSAALGGTETILLVEDEAVLRRTAARALESHGYRVIVASDGGEAIDVLESGPVDLVVTDLIMPRLGGSQLYELAQQRAPEVKFLFTSGYRPHDVPGQADPHPSVPFLPKPWELRDLLTRVREVLDA